jgi:AcrR family transcriptional regulator
MSTTPSPSRRQPRRRRAARSTPANAPSSRAAILAATEAVLLAEGVAGMSIRKVTDRCGYTAPTLYHHFGDKAGLVSALIEERFRQILEVMSSIPKGSDAARYLREMARAFVGFALANPDHYRLLSMPGLDPATVPSAEAARSLVKRALEELAREGTLATADIEAAYEITWAMLHGLISLRLLRPDHPFSDQMLEFAFDVMEGGLLRRAPAAHGRNHA